VLTVSALGLARFALAWSLPPLPLTVAPWYLALSGGVWGLLGLTAACGLFLGAGWAPGLTRWAGLALTAWHWGDRILFLRSDYARQSWPAALALSVMALGFVFWSLSRAGVRRFFEERRA
jgi:hypothetical protein